MSLTPPHSALRNACLACALWAFVACQAPDAAPGGGHAHGGGDDDHGHHDEGPVISLTRSSEQTELFVEFTPLVVGERSRFAAHLTALDGYAPITSGELALELSRDGAVVETFRVVKPAQPGIFRPVALPKQAGRFELRLRWSDGERSDSHGLGAWTVYPSKEAAEGAPLGDEAGPITLLKEQQWQLDFDVAPVQRRALRPSVGLYGALRVRPSGAVQLPAPVGGHLESAPEGWPRVGDTVERGQILATIAPKLDAGGADRASLTAAVRQARLEVEHEQLEVDRLESLFAQGAIPERRVVEARGHLAHARVSLDAAQRRLRQYQRSQSLHQSTAGVEVRAPFRAIIRDVKAIPGSHVDDGAALFELAETASLWLEARVPERLLTKLPAEVEGWFELAGDARRHRLTAAQRVAGLAPVDPHTRTAAMRFDLSPEVAADLPAGAHARVFLYEGDAEEAPVVPRSAVLHEGGEDLVFVQRTGESFERRAVRLGARDGEGHAILEGVSEGERVVTEGAYLVKLASSSRAVPDHGHAH